MKIRGAMIQGGLAVVMLGAAYLTWQREPERAPGEVLALDANKNDVQSVRFESDKDWVELLRRSDAAEPSVWLKLSAKPDQKLPEREVRGNEASDRLFDSFAPLRATRALGVFDARKLKEFGLGAPDVPDGGAPAGATAAWKKRRIEVLVRGDKREFTAGTPAGSFATYLRDERDGRVYLLGGSTLSDLESASTRMVDRTMHGFKPADFDGLTIEAAGKRRDLVVLAPENPAATKLASKKSPDKPDDTAKNWHDKLFRLYPMEVLGKGEKPAAGEPQVALKVSYSNKGADKGFIEVARLTVPAPTPVVAPAPPVVAAAAVPPPAPITEYYARTEHTAGWVKLPTTADELMKEAEKIVASE